MHPTLELSIRKIMMSDMAYPYKVFVKISSGCDIFCRENCNKEQMNGLQMDRHHGTKVRGMKMQYPCIVKKSLNNL